MTRLVLKPAIFLVLMPAWVLAMSSFLPAQDPFADPFDIEPFEPVAPDVVAPDVPRPPDEVEADPLVRQVLDTEPTTPVELVEAMRIMLNIDREDRAREFIERLLALELDQATLVELDRRYGSPFFIRLLRDRSLAPEGRQFAQSVLQAAAEAERQVERIEQLIEQLSDPDAAVRYAAMVDLRGLGSDAAVELVAVLADEQRRQEHPRMGEALNQLGEFAVGPMRGALYAPDEMVRQRVMEAVGRAHGLGVLPLIVPDYLAPDSSESLRQAAGSAIERMLGALPSRAEGRRYLERQIQETLYDEFAEPWREPVVELWRWNEEQGRSEIRRVGVEAGRRMEAAYLSDQLWRLFPEDSSYFRRSIRLYLEADKFLHGLDQPLPRGEGTAHELAAEAGVETVHQVFVSAIGDNQVVGAIAAAEVLGDIGTAELLQAGSGLSGLAAALQHSDRRLRFAAAEAILKIDPTRPFAGASLLTDTLGYFIASQGTPVVLVAHPNRQTALTVSGLYGPAGYEGGTAVTGRELLARAADSDVAAVLISDQLDNPPANETIQLLRRDPRTAELPVGLLMRPESPMENEWYAMEDPRTLAFRIPISVETATRRLERMLATTDRESLSGPQRLQQAEMSLRWLNRILEGGERYSFYQPHRIEDEVLFALQTPELSHLAMTALGWFATDRSQQALVDLASQHALPLADRQAAAEAFEAAVVHRRLRLTRPSVLAQYDRYNASETLDRDTQAVLGAILDTIEAPGKSPEEPRLQP